MLLFLRCMQLGIIAVAAALVTVMILFYEYYNSNSGDWWDDVRRPPIYLGAAIDTSSDNFTAFNSRMGFKSAFFMIDEQFPVVNQTAPVDLRQVTNSSAFYVVTVYPTGFANYTQKDIDDLAKRIGQYAQYARHVSVQLAPYMNTNWYPWGMQPEKFKAFWKDVKNALSAAPASSYNIDFIWTPAQTNDYPLAEQHSNSKFDTNVLSYYPGDDYVSSWGISLLYQEDSTNTLPSDKTLDAMFAKLGKTSAGIYKPYFVVAAGAPYHRYLLDGNKPVISTTSETDIKRKYWTNFGYTMKNTTIASKIYAICIFDIQRAEKLTYRDYRVSSDATVRASFKTMLSNLTAYSFQFAYEIPDPNLPDVVPAK